MEDTTVMTIKQRLLKKIGIYRRENICIYTGTGFEEGTGFDVKVDELWIWGIRFITDVTVLTGGFWLEKLKDKLQK